MEKLHDLTQTFGAHAIVGNPSTTPNNQVHYNPIKLFQAMQQANPVRFLVEAQFSIGPAFQSALASLVMAHSFTFTTRTFALISSKSSPQAPLRSMSPRRGMCIHCPTGTNGDSFASSTSS